MTEDSRGCLSAIMVETFDDACKRIIEEEGEEAYRKLHGKLLHIREQIVACDEVSRGETEVCRCIAAIGTLILEEASRKPDADRHSIGAPSPGDTIWEGPCPACRVHLDVMHGEDEGEVGVLCRGEQATPSPLRVSRAEFEKSPAYYIEQAKGQRQVLIEEEGHPPTIVGVGEPSFALEVEEPRPLLPLSEVRSIVHDLVHGIDAAYASHRHNGEDPDDQSMAMEQDHIAQAALKAGTEYLNHLKEIADPRGPRP